MAEGRLFPIDGTVHLVIRTGGHDVYHVGTYAECKAYVSGAEMWAPSREHKFTVIQVPAEKYRLELHEVVSRDLIVWATVAADKTLSQAISAIVSGSVSELLERRVYDAWRIVGEKSGAVVASGDAVPPSLSRQVAQRRKDTESSFTITRECSVEEAKHGEQEA